MKDIVTVGEMLIDLTQCGVNEQGVPEFLANPGGAPANLAVAAAKLGADTAFVGKVGNDSFGRYLKSVLKENGVDTAGVLTDEIQHTTMAVVSLDGAGERSFSFYRDPSADVNLRAEELPASLIQNTKYLHFGSVSLTTEPCRGATMAAVKMAKEAGATISYDPNYRASLWKDEATATARMREPLELVDVLKLSEEELPLIAGTGDLADGTAALGKLGISLIFVTLGVKGAFYRLGDQTGTVPGVACRVGDTNGAGDTFFGAALSRLAGEELGNLGAERLERIIAYANRAASITTSRHGAIPAMPTADEVEF